MLNTSRTSRGWWRPSSSVAGRYRTWTEVRLRRTRCHHVPHCHTILISLWDHHIFLFLAKPHPCVAYFRTLRRTKLLHLDQWLLAVDLANEMCDDHTSNHAVLPFLHNISSAAKAEENSAAEREVDDARELVRSVHQHVRSVRGPAVCTRQS